MATYEVTAPDGSKWDVTAPEDASQDQVMAYAKSQWGAQKEQAPQRSMGEDLLRQAGLTARAGIKGVAGLPFRRGRITASGKVFACARFISHEYRIAGTGDRNGAGIWRRGGSSSRYGWCCKGSGVGESD
jgi:hypothetical protein